MKTSPTDVNPSPKLRKGQRDELLAVGPAADRQDDVLPAVRGSRADDDAGEMYSS